MINFFGLASSTIRSEVRGIYRRHNFVVGKFFLYEMTTWVTGSINCKTKAVMTKIVALHLHLYVGTGTVPDLLLRN